MSLSILSILPANQAQGIILQAGVIVAFDQEIDTTTFDEQTFLLSGPGTANVTTPLGMIDNQPPTDGVEYVQGKYSFALDSNGRTIATFTPRTPLRPNVVYTVLVTGVESATGATMDGPITSTFTTGVLNIKNPPPQSPLPSAVGRIKPGDITVTPSSTLNNDLHRIVLTFPDNIDPTSFDPSLVQVNLEAFLQDPDVRVPTPLTKTVTVVDNTIVIELTFPGGF